MNKSLPKSDYFKHSTRRFLGDDEKRQIIDATERALKYLNSRFAVTDGECKPIETKTAAMQRLSEIDRILDQLVILVKVATQPRHLYRRSRRFEIELEACRIANETGADYEDVRRVFLQRMNNFVSEYP